MLGKWRNSGVCLTSVHILTVMQRRNSCRREAALLPGRPRGEPRQGHAPLEGFSSPLRRSVTCRSSYKLVSRG